MRSLWLILSLLLSAPAPAHAAEMTVSAAISLKAALEEIAGAFEKAHLDTKITFNFGASGALQQQIENGAPIDLFVSAASKQVDELEKKGFVLEGTRQEIIGNTLVLVVPKGKSNVGTFDDLKKTSVRKIAVGETKAVPAGQYAMEVLTELKLKDVVEKRLVFGSNVQQVLTFVESANADAGFVYGSDAHEAKGVSVIAKADAKWHKPVVYPGVVLKKAKDPVAAKEFLKALGGEVAQNIFVKHGFAPLPAKARD